MINMKKLVLVALLATGLMAASNEDYFGLSVGNAKLEASSSLGNASTDGGQITATLGHYYNDTGRISASYSYIKREEGIKNSDVLSVAYDFILPLADNKIGLYAGPVVGYTLYKDDVVNFSGAHYGAEAGAIIRIADKLELDAGYRYLFETGSDLGVDLDNVKMWYVGANLRF
jgi:opacity protein-like surface antigen